MRYQFENGHGLDRTSADKVFTEETLRIEIPYSTVNDDGCSVSVEELLNSHPAFKKVEKPANSKTIQALIECEEHWMVHAYLPLLRGDVPQEMDIASCSLCTIFRGGDFCGGCPLKEAGMRCNQNIDDNPYYDYASNKTPQTAWDMAKAIRTCREKLEGKK